MSAPSRGVEEIAREAMKVLDLPLDAERPPDFPYSEVDIAKATEIAGPYITGVMENMALEITFTRPPKQALLRASIARWMVWSSRFARILEIEEMRSVKIREHMDMALAGLRRYRGAVLDSFAPRGFRRDQVKPAISDIEVKRAKLPKQKGMKLVDRVAEASVQSAFATLRGLGREVKSKEERRVLRNLALLYYEATGRRTRDLYRYVLAFLKRQ
jgi:hypothetical protein